jgi:hypothetical protein
MALDFRQICRGWAPGRPFEKRPVGQSRRLSGWGTLLQPEGETLL